MQGLLALTFADRADYERIREDDRISLRGLCELAADRPVQCRLVHSDGAAETLWLNHSFSEPQLAWFRAGSALNLLAPPMPPPGGNPGAARPDQNLALKPT